MSDYGIKIASPGYDINDPSIGNYLFHSTYPLLKIQGIYTGSGAFTNGVESLIATIPHNLGYTPMFDVLVGFNSTNTTPTNWYPLSYYVNYPTLGQLEYVKCYTDNTNLYFYYYSSGGGNGYGFYKAVIYYDPLNP